MEKFELFFSYTEESEMSPLSDPLESISGMLECLEGATKDVRRKGLKNLYNEIVKFNAEEGFSEHIKFTVETVLNQGGLTLLIHHFSYLTRLLEEPRDLESEQELRILLNILYAILQFAASEDLLSELQQSTEIFEESILTLIRVSTDVSFIPIKKTCLLFFRYLELVLDSPAKHKYVGGAGEEQKKEGPRCKRQGTAVEGFYRRMICKENVMSQTVVGLLRSLLACCPGGNSQGIDIKQEWLSPLLPCYEEIYQNHADDSRHRYIAAYAISKVLLILLKKFRLNHYLQFQFLSQLINEANGALVFLKFLNLEIPAISKSPVFKTLNPPDRDKLVEKTLKALTQVCYKVNKGHPDRIQTNLIQFKSHLIFKKLLTRYPTSSFELPCLKILRIQVKYLTKKWKSYPSNMKIISEIYQKLKPSKEDWLRESVEEEKENVEEKKQINYEFNYYNYWQPMESAPSESPQLPKDFSESYEEWLEENVWGYSYMY